MSWTLVGSTLTTEAAAATTIQANPDGFFTTVNDLLLLTVSCESLTAAIVQVFDVLGTGYTQAGASFQGYTGQTVWTYWGVSTDTGTGDPVFVVTFNSSVTVRRLAVSRYRPTGSASNLALEGVNQAHGNSLSPMNSGAVTPSVACLLYGYAAIGGDAIVTPAGWTALGAGDANTQAMAQNGAAAGTYQFQPTFINSHSWGAQLVAFRDTAAVTGPAVNKGARGRRHTQQLGLGGRR